VGVIVAETHLWYKAGALEAIKYTHVPILASWVPIKKGVASKGYVED
jgi:hypothetical protein